MPINLRNVAEYTTPTTHPFSMLAGYRDAYEKENTLAWILIKCIEAGEFGQIQTKVPHTDMVQDGLLTEVSPCVYELTDKAVRLLYVEYGKSE